MIISTTKIKSIILIYILLSLIIKSSSRKNPYRVLEVPAYSSFQEIKANYRRLSKKYHPDRNKDNSAKERLLDINEAYEYLKKKRGVDDSFEEDDSYFKHLLTESIGIIIGIYIFNRIQILILKALTWVLERIASFFLIFFSIFYLIDRFISHLFEDEVIQWIVSLIISLFICVMFRKRLRK
jgi:hypothetical protein